MNNQEIKYVMCLKTLKFKIKIVTLNFLYIFITKSCL